MAYKNDIKLKKHFGQHFLKDQSVVDEIIRNVNIDGQSVFEIGPGEGVLTTAILTHPIKKLWAFEIDPEWAEHVRQKIKDPRFEVFNEDFLAVDFTKFKPDAPWVLLANLPYQITFKILGKINEHANLIKEGVIMVQEEVAQKITKTSGKGYGYISIYFQHYFDWKLLRKVPASAFFPPPKVTSRLLYFKPRPAEYIENEPEFWKFIKLCFRQPRRTLKNNLIQGHYDLDKVNLELLPKRAQELSKNDLLNVWKLINK